MRVDPIIAQKRDNGTFFTVNSSWKPPSFPLIEELARVIRFSDIYSSEEISEKKTKPGSEMFLNNNSIFFLSGEFFFSRAVFSWLHQSRCYWCN